MLIDNFYIFGQIGPLTHFLFLKNKFYLFIYLGRVGSLLQRVGATLRCGARASHCSGFSCCGAQALGPWASVAVARGLSSFGTRALEHRLSGCGTWA